MSNVAHLLTGAAAATDRYLGPAEVIKPSTGALVIALPDGTVSDARLALQFPYQAEQGDQVLVIGEGGVHYVIGVLDGQGASQLHFQGDVDIAAVGGVVKIAGDKGVALKGPEISLAAKKVVTSADRIVNKCSALYQRVRGLMSVHAQEAHTVVDRSAVTKAKNATILTEEVMTINGQQIHLG